VPIGNDGVQVRLLDQGKGDPHVDAYWMSCAPNTLRKAEAHSHGTSETVTIISGELEVGTVGDTKALSAGDTHTFRADKPHIYRAGDTWTALLVAIIYAKGEKAT